MSGKPGSKWLAFLLPAMLGVVLGNARAQKSAGVGTPSSTSTLAATADPAKTSIAKLSDLGWLAGQWEGAWGPRIAEQDWMAPQAGLMVGTFRVMEGDKTLVIELFTLLQKTNGVDFRFLHFTPDLDAWEKDGPTVLTLQSVDSKHFVFVNNVNGQPKRAILTRVDQDTYISRSEILPASGDLQVVEITYHRQRPANGGSGGHRKKP